MGSNVMIPLSILIFSTVFNTILLGTVGIDDDVGTVNETVEQDAEFGVFQVFDAIGDFMSTVLAAATWDFPGIPGVVRGGIILVLVGSVIWAIVELIRGT